MRQWEYQIIHTRIVQEAIFLGKSPHKSLTEYFNGLGREGWEILNFGQFLDERGVSIYSDCLAKREIMPGLDLHLQSAE